MKSFIHKILLLCVLASFGHTTAWAVKVIIDGVNYSINSNNQTASVVNGKKTYLSGDIKIAESVTYKDQIYKVTAIEEKAFSNCKNLTSVTIPDGVTSIGEDAFCKMFLECHNNQNQPEISNRKPLISNIF